MRIGSTAPRLLVGALITLAALPAAAAAERPLDLGLIDGQFQSPDAATRSSSLSKAKSASDDLTLLNLAWNSTAPSERPAGFNPRDPGDPAYDWGTLDGAVRSAKAKGLKVAVMVGQAPAWAEGANRPRRYTAGSWKPKPGPIEDFGHALARRYSGTYRDPDAPGAKIPRVRHFQLWAEPNLEIYLSPQFKNGKPVAPRIYRRMLRAFYAGVKSVKRSDKVITGGTAPYGDLGSRGARMQPVRFWRQLLCLKGHKLRTTRCRKPAKFDIAAHHPINVGAPTRHAINADDASTPDIGRISRVVRKAVATGRALPSKRKPFWATEIWWDSRPPDPAGVPVHRQARYLSQALFVLWKQRVRTVVWLHLRDPLSADLAATQESGLYTRSGKPKPILRAFRFPLAARRVDRGRVKVWLRAPTSRVVKIERKRRGHWRVIARSPARRHGVVMRSIRASGKAKLRARQGKKTTSPSFTVR